jgi:hypothetical protein
MRQEEIAKLPDPLYTVLGRIWGYMEAVDAEASRIAVGVVSADEAHGVEVEGQGGPVRSGSAAAPTITAMEVVVPSGGGDDLDESTIRPPDPPKCVVAPHALCLKVLDSEHAGTVPYELLFYYCVPFNAVVVHSPEDPHGLINLMPADTGSSLRSPTVPSIVALDESWKGPRPYSWAQWLGGILPLPPRVEGLAPEYSSACLLDRLLVRLRTRRILSRQMAQLCRSPGAPPLDPQVDRALFPDLGGGERPWTLVKCVELQRANVPEGLFNDSHGELDVEAGPVTEPPECDDRTLGESGTAAGVTSRGITTTGPCFGAKYFELSLSAEKQDGERKAATTKAYVEVCADYPVRPARFRLVPPGSSRKSNNQGANPCKYAETEVNAYSESLLADHPSARYWLLLHQVYRLLVCMGSANSGGSGGVTRRVAPRGVFSQDVHARLLLCR